MNRYPSSSSRRSLLKGSVFTLAAAAVPFVNALQLSSLRQREHGQSLLSLLSDSAYGPLQPVRDLTTGLELLQLPEGFSYMSFSWTGELMTNGQPVPHGHDGMGVVALQSGSDGEEIVLIRNHELGAGAPIGAKAVYDAVTNEDGTRAGGGNTTLFFPRKRGGPVRTEPSLGGTLANCAGGVTPWGTWLSCEETIADLSAAGGLRHGYVFEVSPDPAWTSGKPIVKMGRFKHEAVAVDVRTGTVYLTEDNRNMSAIYRYLPEDRSPQPGALEKGGRLQAAKVSTLDAADLLAPGLGDEYALEWVDIADPDGDPVENASGPWLQARAAGALSISRGEGIWYADGLIYIVDTSAGRNAEGAAGHGEGAVWMLAPDNNRMRCIFASPNAVVGNNPDNITISPRGGVLMCEDGGGVEDHYGFGERVIGLTTGGDSFIFAKNNIVLTADQIATAGLNVQPGEYRDSEIAGATFDPQGEYLFINIQKPGLTLAIWGPWEKGPL